MQCNFLMFAGYSVNIMSKLKVVIYLSIDPCWSRPKAQGLYCGTHSDCETTFQQQLPDPLIWYFAIHKPIACNPLEIGWSMGAQSLRPDTDMKESDVGFKFQRCFKSVNQNFWGEKYVFLPNPPPTSQRRSSIDMVLMRNVKLYL